MSAQAAPPQTATTTTSSQQTATGPPRTRRNPPPTPLPPPATHPNFHPPRSIEEAREQKEAGQVRQGNFGAKWGVCACVSLSTSSHTNSHPPLGRLKPQRQTGLRNIYKPPPGLTTELQDRQAQIQQAVANMKPAKRCVRL